MLKTGVLSHCGIMVNYQCTAACRHCLYAGSPTRRAGYISRSVSREVCRLLSRGGCGSVHIGGGEPFLDFNGLISVIRELRNADISPEYVETNAYWAGNDDAAEEKLRILRQEGVNTLCISLDLYHVEYVPYEYPLRLARICEKTGMQYFLWKEQFLPVLSRLPPASPHSSTEMEHQISPDYIADTARSYGIQLGGRAINIENEYVPLRPVDRLLEDTPCRNLLSTGHFHIDLDACFIPPGCTGLRLPLAELIAGIPGGKYPVFEALYSGGIRKLLELAHRYGFVERRDGYPSKCNLCFHIRRYLVRHGFSELDGEHYEESLKYY